MDHAFPLDHKDGPTLSPRRVKDDYDPSPTLFVGGISYEATREDIREALRPLGHIVAVRIGPLPCRTGQPNRMLNPSLYRTRSGKELEGVRTYRLRDYR